MNNRIIIYIIVIFGFIFTMEAQTKINVLNSNYYGFEVSSGDDGWWMQQPNNWSITTDKAADGSSRSLKYINSTTFLGSKKVFGSSKILEMLIDLEPGDYDLKAKVWLTSGSDISAIKANFRTAGESDVNVVFDLSAINEDQWVEVTTSFHLSNAFSDTNIRILMEASYGGIGTLYFDELQLWKDIGILPEEVPVTSVISTLENEHISLSRGEYEIDLNIWVDEGSTIPNFYTQIIEPWTSIKWDIKNIAKGKWVTLKNNFTLEKDTHESKFQILVGNVLDGDFHQGGFYLDAIEFTKIADLDRNLFDVKVLSESCQGKENGQIIISNNVSGDYYVQLEGVTTDFRENIVLENLAPGSYSLKVGVNGSSEFYDYIMNIEEAINIEASVTSQINKTRIEITEGTAPYRVYKNGLKIKESVSNTFEVETQFGDLIEVKTALDCEGVFSSMDSELYIYPNPADTYFTINCPIGSILKMYNASGSLIRNIETKEEVTKIVLSGEISGIYYVEVLMGAKWVVKKVVVK